MAYSDTIRTTTDGDLDMESVESALNSIKGYSRVVLLVSHDDHGYGILKHAKESGFPADTIWVGPSAWAGRSTPNFDFGWLPDIPGYMGVAPRRFVEDQVYQDFFEEWKSMQMALHGKTDVPNLAAFAAETVDSIVALTKALSSSSDRRDGPAVVRRLRELEFNGVSGKVRFTPTGDRKDPQYTIYNAQHDGSTGDIVWTAAGSTGIEAGSAELFGGIQGICFAQKGCGLNKAPDDSYPIPGIQYAWWVTTLIVVPVLLLCGLALKYWRSHKSKVVVKAELNTLKDSVVGMRVAQVDYIPSTKKPEPPRAGGGLSAPFRRSISGTPRPRSGSAGSASDLSVRGSHRRSLSRTLRGSIGGSVRQDPPVQWCWKETKSQLSKYSADDIAGDPSGCWIKYDKSSNDELEMAYMAKKDECSPLPGYSVSFLSWEQTNLATGYTREVQRLSNDDHIDSTSATVTSATASNSSGQDSIEQFKVDLGDAKLGQPLPIELAGEPQMVLVKGDIIQLAKQRADGFAFGTKVSPCILKKLFAVILAFVLFLCSAISHVSYTTPTRWLLAD